MCLFVVFVFLLTVCFVLPPTCPLASPAWQAMPLWAPETLKRRHSVKSDVYVAVLSVARAFVAAIVPGSDATVKDRAGAAYGDAVDDAAWVRFRRRFCPQRRLWFDHD